MFYVTLQQQLCGRHDVWHNFQDENYFQNFFYNIVTLAQWTKYSRNTTKQSFMLAQNNISNKNSFQQCFIFNWSAWPLACTPFGTKSCRYFITVLWYLIVSSCLTPTESGSLCGESELSSANSAAWTLCLAHVCMTRNCIGLESL